MIRRNRSVLLDHPHRPSATLPARPPRAGECGVSLSGSWLVIGVRAVGLPVVLAGLASREQADDAARAFRTCEGYAAIVVEFCGGAV